MAPEPAPASQDRARKAVEAVWRIESSRIIAGLTRMVRDVGLAEELAQDALVSALEQWPESGIPDNPGAWLMAAAKRRGIDRFRRDRRWDDKQQEIARDLWAKEAETPDLAAAVDDFIPDDLLRLMFTACHPVLPKEARVALTLRLLGGLTTEEIARAFLAPEPTVAQRIVRAKRTLAEARVPFELPDRAAMPERLASVLEVLYLVFNEGYSATAGSDWMRPALCEDAMRLGRVLAAMAPEESEVHGLVALMELQASRMPARTGPGGAPVLLNDQDRSRWDRLLIAHGLAALEKAEGAGRSGKAGGALGPYALQAAIAACHARALRAEDTDWARIAALYDALVQSVPSPIIELNRAVAVAMAYGPEAGLEILDDLLEEPALQGYHLLPAARGDLLARSGRWTEAREAFVRAAELARNEKERKLLSDRVAACATGALWWKATHAGPGRPGTRSP
jgi:RNA polymerase sigma factor (sigma-70 family)